MRIAFSTLGRLSIENMQRTLSDVARIRQQVASGRKFDIPSQDPIGAQRSVDLSAELTAIRGFKASSNNGLMYIESAESALFEIGDQLREAKSIALSQLNATADSSSREATAVAIRSIKQQLMTLMNTEVQGRYLFAGHRTTTTPFAEGASGGIEYFGDQGEIIFRVGPNQFEVTNVAGSDVAGTSSSYLRSSLDWSPVVNGATALNSLNRGSGVGVGQFQIDDGIGGTLTLNTTAMVSVQEVIDQINASGIGVTAQINPSQNGIMLTAANVTDTITVTDLNGGTAAADLGILNSGTGVLVGTDLDPAVQLNTPLADIPTLTTLPLGSIRVLQGSTQAVVSFGSPPPAATVGEVITRFNSVVPGVTMGLSPDGTALEISGIGAFTIVDNLPDTTATQMGIAGTGRQSRLFGSLEAMEQAMLADDRDGIEDALFELERVMTNVVGVQGVVASRARRIDLGRGLLDSYQFRAETRLADVQATDMAEAITHLTEAQTLYQTALGTAASVFDLNLFNYIY